MKIVNLTRGYIALVSDDDYERVNQYQWYACVVTNHKKQVTNVYAARTDRRNGSKKSVMMHRELLGVQAQETFIDHRDGNGLNNQRENLRECSNRENQQNSRPHRDALSAYKGVSWRADRGKWIAKITYDNRRVYLGSFDSEHEAARAYDYAAQKFFNEFARPNHTQQETTNEQIN